MDVYCLYGNSMVHWIPGQSLHGCVLSVWELNGSLNTWTVASWMCTVCMGTRWFFEYLDSRFMDVYCLYGNSMVLWIPGQSLHGCVLSVWELDGSLNTWTVASWMCTVCMGTRWLIEYLDSRFMDVYCLYGNSVVDWIPGQSLHGCVLSVWELDGSLNTWTVA